MPEADTKCWPFEQPKVQFEFPPRGKANLTAPWSPNEQVQRQEGCWSSPLPLRACGLRAEQYQGAEPRAYGIILLSQTLRHSAVHSWAEVLLFKQIDHFSLFWWAYCFNASKA